MGISTDTRCVGIVKNGNNCKKHGLYKTSIDNNCFCIYHVPKLEDKCVICLNYLYDVSILDCEHKFHTRCIQKWMKLNNTCPICRSQICTDIHSRNMLEQQQLMLDIASMSHLVENIHENINNIIL
jgi:hypothetical protein